MIDTDVLYNMQAEAEGLRLGDTYPVKQIQKIENYNYILEHLEEAQTCIDLALAMTGIQKRQLKTILEDIDDVYNAIEMQQEEIEQKLENYLEYEGRY